MIKSESEFKGKLEEFGFESQDGVEWVQHLYPIGRVGARFSQSIYKTQEVRVVIGYKVEIYDKDDTYEDAYRHIAEIMVEFTMSS